MAHISLKIGQDHQQRTYLSSGAPIHLSCSKTVPVWKCKILTHSTLFPVELSEYGAGNKNGNNGYDTTTIQIERIDENKKRDE